MFFFFLMTITMNLSMNNGCFVQMVLVVLILAWGEFLPSELLLKAFLLRFLLDHNFLMFMYSFVRNNTLGLLIRRSYFNRVICIVLTSFSLMSSTSICVTHLRSWPWSWSSTNYCWMWRIALSNLCLTNNLYIWWSIAVYLILIIWMIYFIYFLMTI